MVANVIEWSLVVEIASGQEKFDMFNHPYDQNAIARGERSLSIFKD